MRTSIKLFAVAIALSAFAAPAQATEYVVHSCKLPDGRPAPTDGWRAEGAAPYMWFDDACSRGGPLTSGIAGVLLPANHAAVGWAFRSDVAAIHGYRVIRSGVPRGANVGASMLAYSADAANTISSGRVIDYCASYRGCGSIAGMLTRSTPAVPEGSHAWFFSLVCGGNSGDTCVLAPGQSDFGSLRIDQASFTLEDPQGPTSEPATGTLDVPGATSGSLRFVASDTVSGVRRATIEADGVAVANTTPDSNGGRCAEIGQSVLPDFAYLRPCPARVQAEVSLAPGTLTPGEHRLRARVYDAAGNATTVWGPQTVNVSSSKVGAASSARFVPDGAKEMRASFGRRPRVSGVLTSANGSPISGSEVIVTMRAPAAATSTRTVRLVTDGAGRYAFRVNAISSRAIELVHPSSGAELLHRLTVRAPIRLRSAARRVRSLGRMRLTGQLKTERTRRGASVAITVKSGRTWRTIGVTRADTRGRFRFSYRFRRTRHASFVFRAVAVRSGDLAVAPSPSNLVRIRVG